MAIIDDTISRSEVTTYAMRSEDIVKAVINATANEQAYKLINQLCMSLMSRLDIRSTILVLPVDDRIIFDGPMAVHRTDALTKEMEFRGYICPPEPRATSFVRVVRRPLGGFLGIHKVQVEETREQLGEKKQTIAVVTESCYSIDSYNRGLLPEIRAGILDMDTTGSNGEDYSWKGEEKEWSDWGDLSALQHQLHTKYQAL